MRYSYIYFQHLLYVVGHANRLQDRYKTPFSETRVKKLVRFIFFGDFEDRDSLESIGLRVPIFPKLAEALDGFGILFREVLRFSHVGAHVIQLPGNFVLQWILWFLGYGLGDEFPFAVSHGSATTKLKKDGFIPPGQHLPLECRQQALPL